MRAVVQRTTQAWVEVEGERVGQALGPALTVLLGAAQGDTEADVAYLVDKIVNLRVFEDADGKMNLSLAQVGGSLLVVSQFTLYGDCRKGRRPSFIDALEPNEAERLVAHFVRLAQAYLPVETGRFRTHMQVSLVNDGPVTLLLDSRKTF